MIPEPGLAMLKAQGYEVLVGAGDRALTREELKNGMRDADAVLSQLTDKIDKEVLGEAGPNLKIIANYAVGFDNIDVEAARTRNILVTNTPDVLTETVAEHTFALMLAISHRLVEADKFARAGQYIGWEPFLLLGSDLSHKTLGVIGLGRIGSRVAHHAVGSFDMKVIYYDVKRNEDFEKEFKAVYKDKLEDLLGEADFVSIHAPLLEATRHLIDAAKLRLMKPSAYLINTARGPIVDEAALAEALKNNIIRGAAIDVFEFEPQINPGLLEHDNVIITPHIASATVETRSKMSELAAKNIIEALSGRVPTSLVK